MQLHLILTSATAGIVSMILFGCTGESTPSQLSRNTSDYPTTQVVGNHLPNNINTQRRLALIIGNASYTEVPELKNPTNDAQDLAKTLRDLGFEVIEEENVKNSKDMRDIVLNFGNKLRRGGVGLFYYSGHGIQVNGENYLIPTSANLRSEADVGYEALGMSYVQETLDEANNGMNIIILDACRDNPFSRSIKRSRSTKGGSATGLAQMDSAKGSLIAFSTSPGSTAEDGAGRNGTYTKYLLANIKEPGVSVEGLFKRVRVGVAEETNGQQTPWESTSLTGDFCFAGCQDPTVAAAAAKAVETAAQASSQAAQAAAEAERLRKEIEQQKLEAERLKAEAESLKKQHLESQQFKVETLKKQQQLEAQRLATEAKIRQKAEKDAQLKAAAEQARLAAEKAAETNRQQAIAEKQAQQKAVEEQKEQQVKVDANKKLQEAIARAWQEQQQKQITEKNALEAHELREQQAQQQQQTQKQQKPQPSQPSQAIAPPESGENENRNIGSF